MRATTRALSVAGAFALAVSALTGCAGAAPMTQEEACAYLETEITGYMDSVEDQVDDDSMSPAEMVSFQKDVLNKFDSIGNGVNNNEVKTSFKNLISATQGLLPLVEKSMDDPSILGSDEAADALEKVTTASEEFSTLCPTSGANVFG